MIFRNENGFVLAATIIILAAITIGTSLFALEAERKREEAALRKATSRRAIDRFSTFNAVVYLLSTGKMESGGLLFKDDLSRPASQQTTGNRRFSPFLLPLDNKAFKGYGDTVFAIQDESGLLSVNSFTDRQWFSLLAGTGIPWNERAPLLAKLRDYTDSDDNFHLNGGERQHYRQEGRIGPANRQLFTTRELKHVLGWDQYPQLWHNDRIARLTTAAFSGAININSAPPEILATLQGLDRHAVQRITALRRSHPIGSLYELERIVGRPLPGLDINVIYTPTRYQRITLWESDGLNSEEIHFQLKPFAGTGIPWQMSSHFTLPFNSSAEEGQHPDEIPFFTETLDTDNE